MGGGGSQGGQGGLGRPLAFCAGFWAVQDFARGGGGWAGVVSHSTAAGSASHRRRAPAHPSPSEPVPHPFPAPRAGRCACRSRSRSRPPLTGPSRRWASGCASGRAPRSGCAAAQGAPQPVGPREGGGGVGGGAGARPLLASGAGWRKRRHRGAVLACAVLRLSRPARPLDPSAMIPPPPPTHTGVPRVHDGRHPARAAARARPADGSHPLSPPPNHPPNPQNTPRSVTLFGSIYALGRLSVRQGGMPRWPRSRRWPAPPPPPPGCRRRVPAVQRAEGWVCHGLGA